MRLVLISLMTGTILLAFQNCSEVSFDTAPATLQAQQVEFESSSSIQIDDNAEFTRQSLVQLKLSSIRAVEMKISNNPDCSDGMWEPFTTGKAWTLSKSNDRVKVYAIYKDIIGNVTSCVADEIIHDDVPPVASFNNGTGLITNNNQINLTFSASDNMSGVDTAVCIKPDGSSAACTNAFTVTSASDGNKTASVRVTDKAGNTSNDVSYSWLVDTTAPVVTINSQPANLTGSGSASLSFSGHDVLSGIASYSCRMDGGAYQSCNSPVNYSGLANGPRKFEVLAIDRAGNTSALAVAQWTVDMTAPSLSFTQTPPLFSNDQAASFSFIGTDDGVAISKFDCSVDNLSYSSCSSPRQLTGLTEGVHTFSVRGYDAANNLSSPISYQWTVDLTPPTVNITAGPSGLTNDTSANFQWTVADSGSGVKTVECQLGAAAFTRCGNSGHVYPNVVAGPQTMRVRVTDVAGNSRTVSRSWNVDLTLPTVQILTGPAVYVNSTSAQFTFQATDNNGIAGYECRVDAGNYTSCSSPHTQNSLAEGGHTFFVRAIDTAGNVSLPASHSWTIDRSPPLIRVLAAPTAIKQGDPAIISYEVIDPSSGVGSVNCGLSSPTNNVAACTAKQSVDLGRMLAVGIYTFDIQATDNVGNSLTETVSFQVTAGVLICDPFVAGADEACDGGLIGDIFYLDSNNQAAFKAMGGKTVDYFYSNGIQVDAVLALKQLAVSTRNFTDGFPTSGGGLILDNNGAPLHEYFAFRLKTVLKLDPTLDQPGFYQFATLSDDGSMVLMKPNGSTNYSSVIVSNDGDHATRMGCSSSAIYIDDTSRLPLMIKYYQGPRTAIALTLLWRKVPAMNSALDSACGKSGPEEFFGPSWNDFTNYTFGKMVKDRGWKVIAPSNLIAPPL